MRVLYSVEHYARAHWTWRVRYAGLGIAREGFALTKAGATRKAKRHARYLQEKTAWKTL